MNKHTIKKVMMFFGLTLTGIIPVNSQQNIQFTQYIFNSLSVNPAYAGYKEEWFGQLALRSQWTDINGAPKTGQFSVDGILDPEYKRMGLGVQVTADKLGPQSAVSAYANYAYRLQLDAADTKRLSFGIGLGLTSYGLDATMLSAVGPNDPNLNRGQLNSVVPNARFGVYYYDPTFYVGASIMDLFSSDKQNGVLTADNNTVENIQRRRHVYLIAGILTNLSDDVKLKPGILVKEDFKGPTSLDLNGMFIFANRIWLGASYRTGLNLWKKDYNRDLDLTRLNSLAGIAQFYVSDNLRIGYSYDHLLNDLGNAGGTHEISLGFTLSKKSRRLVSPRFF